MKIFTIGVYGSLEDEFFGKLVNNHIDLFCDIRQRRGVRGSKYAFVNSNYLQNKLMELGIGYVYEKRLAPTKEIREMQWEADKLEHQTKKTRETLGHAFCEGYKSLVLDKADLDALVNIFTTRKANNVVLFCLEEHAEACHRSLLAQKLADIYGFEVVNL